MRIFLAHASAFDFRKKLYEPIRASALNAAHEFILPEEREGIYDTREDIRSCDALIADVSLPSTGAGIEMGWADAAGVPIVAIRERGSVPSGVVAYVTDAVIEYADADDLIAKLGRALEAARKRA